MTVLIVSDPVDLHASAVAWALHRHGAEATLWHPATRLAPASAIRLDSASVELRCAGRAGGLGSPPFGAVWMRRWPTPTVPSELVEPGDGASLDGLVAYHAGMLAVLARGILWANPPAPRELAGYAPRQLAAAVAAGFAIPRTVVTDDVAEARDFVAAHGGAVVHKPVRVVSPARGGRGSSPAAPVARAVLDDPQALVWAPGLFQEVVPSAGRLRVCIFGRTCIAARILDRDPVDGSNLFGPKVVPHNLTQRVERRLFALMDALELAMAMVDFIVTPDGDEVFVEVHEQGQFLWGEEMCPDLPLLDVAARFLASGDPAFRTEVVPGRGVGLDEYLREEAARYRKNGAVQVNGSIRRGPRHDEGRGENPAPPRRRKAGLL